MPVEVLIAALTALPFTLVYWVMRFLARRRLAAGFRAPRPWQPATLERWAQQGWLHPELAGILPGELSPAAVLYDWAWADRETPRHWRLTEPVRPDTPFEAVVRDLWSNLKPEQQQAARSTLEQAVPEAAAWWGGAERGWNRRPLTLLGSAIGRKQEGLPLLGIDDLTAAPLPSPIDPEIARSGDGPDLVLALAALRRCRPRFVHALAPRPDAPAAMLSELSTRVGSNVGAQIGAGIGAALGPIGSMIGRTLGQMVGTLGGQAVAAQALPEPVAAALKEAEAALAALGRGAPTDDFARAARRPADTVLEFGKEMEVIRQDRSRRLRERVWPTAGLGAVEEVLRVALAQLQDYRAAADHFVAAARAAPDAVAGGMILQNPWLVRDLPGAVERLNAARQTLNRAATVIRRARPPD